MALLRLLLAGSTAVCAPDKAPFDARGKIDVTLAKGSQGFPPRERRKALPALAKKFTTQNLRPEPNHHLRTNCSLGNTAERCRARKGYQQDALFALKEVAQGAAPGAKAHAQKVDVGPEAFGLEQVTNVPARSDTKAQISKSPIISTCAKRLTTLAESTLPQKIGRGAYQFSPRTLDLQAIPHPRKTRSTKYGPRFLRGPAE